MNASAILYHVKCWLTVFFKRCQESARYVPALVRRPRLAVHVVTTAGLAQIVLVSSIVGMLWLAPTVVGSVAKVLYRQEKALFGLVKKPNAGIDTFRRRAMTTLKLGSGGVVLLLFWLHIPKGVRVATRRSGHDESKADALKNKSPDESLRLYRKAMSLAPDPRDQDSLREKIQEVEGSLSHEDRLDKTQMASRISSLRLRLRPSALIRHFIPPARVSRVGRDGRYRLDTELGHGGMGVVYCGHDTVLDRKVAVKGLPEGLSNDGDFVSRFHQEAKALAFLSHPCIVQVYDFVEERGRVWILLEYVEGGDLSVYLRQCTRLEAHETARLGQHLADALHYAHEQGIVHRDFKPSNVLLTPERNPKITDFGLAKLMGSSSLTHSGTILGSVRYMSPEQASGKVADRRCDMYSLGITLYELLSGRTPFEGDASSILAQHITQAPPPLRDLVDDVPADLENLIMGLLAKDPEERTQDLTAIARQLGALAGSGQLTAVRA
jgi:hypothetical protein